MPMTWSIVDLPLPDGPDTATISPLEIRTDTRSRALTGGEPGYCLVTSRSSIAGASGSGAANGGRERITAEPRRTFRL